jgi:lipoprotein-anchoring transpeptidase ErfK/SrfK
MGAVLLYRSDLIMPGVQVLDVQVGGKSKARAAAVLQEAWLRRQIVLRADGTALSVVPSVLGVALDVRLAIQTAYERGRSPDRVEAVLRGEGRMSIPPVLAVDLSAAEANLRELAPRFYVPPVDASARVVAGRVEAVPPVAGRALDAEATAAWLQGHTMQVIADGKLDLVFTAVQPAIADVSDFVAQANEWLSSPLAIRAYDPVTDETSVWTVEPEVWGAWLSLSVDMQDSLELRKRVDSDRIRAHLEAQAATLSHERYIDLGQAVAAVERGIAAQDKDVRVRVYHPEGRHVVQLGETLASIARDYGMPYPWLQQANPDVGDALRPGQALTIPSPDVLLPLPVVEDKRIVVSIGEQTMWAFEGGKAKWVWPVSTGIPSSPTSPGVFQIQSHDLEAYASSWDLWMPYFMGIYRPVPTSTFMNGFHGFPTRDGSSLLWTGSLGYPVTFGCILVSTENIALLYEWAEEGVVVEIKP